MNVDTKEYGSRSVNAYSTASMDASKWPGRPSAEFLMLEHQLNEAEHPEVALHSCRYCASIIIDMRKEAGDSLVSAKDPDTGDKRIVGWELANSKPDIGFTSAQATMAAGDGCALFASLTRGLSFHPSGSGEENPIQAQFSIHREDRATVTMYEHDLARETASISVTSILGEFELYAIPGQATLDRFLGHALLPPNLVPNSRLSFTRARMWLDECRASHRQCNVFNLSYMPTRVLQVFGGPDPSGPPSLHVRLVENPEPGPYATLSYCWGGDQHFKTTKERLPGYQREIALDTLAQTIRDAVTVTHGIGIRYLWIDALCIIQDDNDDKMKEISNMHHIYRGSLFTIAATTAASSSAGFLQPRTTYRPFKLRVKTDDDSQREVAMMPTRSRQDQQVYPLYTRGWTFQEGQLSTRTFAYGNRGMVYSCLESKNCDGGHQHPVRNRGSNEDAISGIFKNLDPGSQLHGTATHPFAWGDIVDAYTQRRLTFADDKLLAITAIAEEYLRTKPVTEYLAGMWAADLLYQCLWRRARSTRRDLVSSFTRPAAYRAPSWSWATLDGHVNLPLYTHRLGLTTPQYNFSCQLIDARVTRCDGASPFGSVKGGQMRLRGRIRRVIWVSPKEYNQETDGVPSDGYGWAHGDPDDKWQQPGKIPGDDRLDFNIDIISEWLANSKIALWCVELCTSLAQGNVMEIAKNKLYDERGSSSILEGHGLLLEPVNQETAGEPTFRRAGAIGFKGLPVGDPFFDRWPYWFDDGESLWREIVIV